MGRPDAWTLAQLRDIPLREAVAWVTPSARAMVLCTFPGLTLSSPGATLHEGVDTLVVFGGGALMDRAKLLRRERSDRLRLIVVPSIWGSGSEVSRIAVQDSRTPGAGKVVAVDAELLPDVRVEWPELVACVPAARACHASGDVWAHALEALVSPIADDDVRRDAGALVKRMLAMPLAHHADWMECSRQACELQARSSVGLAHGLAHALEGSLRTAEPQNAWGHARLCSLFLWPVLRLNDDASPKWRSHLALAELDAAAVLERARELFSPEDYRRIMPTLVSEWARVLRDPCTRTNVSVVRPRSLDYLRALAS